MYRVLVGMALLGGMTTVAADQYRSESRIVTPSTATKSHAQLLKEAAGNPYGQALILKQQAEQAIGQKNYSAAIENYERALQLNSLSDIATGGMRYNLAQLYLTQHHYDKAAQLLQQWVDRTSATGQKPPATAYAALAAAYIGMKQPRKALKPIQQAIAQDPKPHRDWMQIQFSIHYQLDELDECVRLVQQMLEQFPPDKATWMQLVALQSRLNHPKEAASAMTLAYRQGFLQQSKERIQLAQLLFAAGQSYDAAALLDQWIKAGDIPETLDTVELLATCWLKAKEKQRALAAMQQAAAMRGKPEQYLEIAQLNLELERWDDAVKALQSAFQRGLPTAKRGKAYLAMGFAQFMQKNNTAALQAFTAAASLRDTAAPAKSWLDFIHAGIQAKASEPLRATSEAQQPAQTALHVTEQAAQAADAITPVQTATVATGTADADGLTPVGAMAAGSVDGRIPPWTGGLSARFTPNVGRIQARTIDPFPDDKPLFVIDTHNAEQYHEFLSEGHQALLKRYEDYRMPIYPTRRSVFFPESVYAATKTNQQTAKLVSPDVLKGVTGGFPFRVPKTGSEVLWNHRVHYRGENWSMRTAHAAVDDDGQYTLNRAKLWLYFVYGNPHLPSDLKSDNLLLYYLSRVTAPSSAAGLTVLVHETTDLTRGRGIWAAPPSAHRLFRLPAGIGYDYVLPDSDGMKFVDQINMYNGGFDRYTWKLVGRRPYFAPYNSYRVNAPQLRYADILTPKHFNQAHTRYELHRLWVVEAVTRPDTKHAFKRRVFYVDEDSWVILMVDCYDHDGNLWRFQEGHGLHHYQVPMMTTAPELLYDFKDSRYLASFLSNEEDAPIYNDPELRPKDFTPSAARNQLH